MYTPYFTFNDFCETDVEVYDDFATDFKLDLVAADQLQCVLV
jgi:hypothetical protein